MSIIVNIIQSGKHYIIEHLIQHKLTTEYSEFNRLNRKPMANIRCFFLLVKISQLYWHTTSL